MPVECDIEPVPITRDEYHKLDYEVTGIAFDIYNQMGRLHNESTYCRVLARRLAERGHRVEVEVPITVSHGEFAKTFYMDMVVDRCIVYEIKCVEALHGRHEAQLINYLVLSAVWWGKLVNFGPESVDGYYLSACFTEADRYDYSVDVQDWEEVGETSAGFKETILELARDWGMFLDSCLFYEALCQFMGGREEVLCPVDIVDRGQTVGSERMLLLSPNVTFDITAIKDTLVPYRTHLSRKLSCTRLRAMQWVNFEKHRIRFITLRNEGSV